MSRIRNVVLLLVLGRAAAAGADPIVDLTRDDPSGVPVGTSHRMRPYLNNFGDAPLTITRLELVGGDAAHFQFANPAGPACNGGQVCDDPFTMDVFGFVEVDVLCSVDWSALFTTTLIVTSNASNNPASWTISCEGGGPHIDFTPREVTFPTTRVGYWSAPQTVQITRAAGTPFRPVSAPGFVSTIDGLDCRFGCFVPEMVSIWFTPASPGAHSRELRFENDDGAIGIRLLGTARGPELTFETPQTMQLGSARLGQPTPPGTIRIRNTGNEVLRITALVAGHGPEADAFSITPGSIGPRDVAPNATVEWQAICRPIRPGDNSDTYQIESDAVSANASLLLRCGGDSGSLALDTFPRLPPTKFGSTSTVEMPIRNVGNLPVAIPAVVSDDPQFTVAPAAGSFPITLPPGTTTVFEVRFAPTRGGDQVANLTFGNDAVGYNGAAFFAQAFGLGLSGQVDLDPAAAAIGNVPVGTTGEATVHLGNHGEETIILQSITIADPAQFAVPDLWLIGAAFATGEGAPVAIQATPTAPGPLDTTITFAFDRGPPTTVHVTAVGVASALAVATWDKSPVDGVFDFGHVKAGSDSTGLVSVTNTGTATLRIATCSVVGDTAFTVATPCAIELAPNASADLEIGFAPVTAGTHTATLHFMSDATNAMAELSLVGDATPGRGGCAAGGDAGGLGLIVVGLLVLGRTRRRAVTTTLLLVAGCSTGIPGDSTSARRSGVTVGLAGSGKGTVASLTPAIQCGTRCSATFDDAIHLAATASRGSMFVGWEGRCAGTGPCVVRSSDAPAEVIARFERHVQLTITGEAPVSRVGSEVTVDGARCPLPCVRSVQLGSEVKLDVFTLSTFTGWSGGCTAAPSPCTLTVTADTHLTAHFTTPDELWTTVDDAIVPTQVTMVGDDPVVAGGDGSDLVVARYTSAGARTWLTRIPIGPEVQTFGLDHNTGGQIYVLAASLDGLTVQKLSASGQPLWSKTLPGASPNDLSDYSAIWLDRDELAVAPNGDVAMIALGNLDVYRDDGTLRWTRRLLSYALDVSVDAAGTFTVVEASNLNGQFERYDPSGAWLGQYFLPTLVPDVHPEPTYQAFVVAGDQLIAQSDGLVGHATLTAVNVATGALIWSLNALNTIGGPAAFGVDGRGDVVMLGAALHKLSGRAIVWRRTGSHAFSPGGRLDSMGARDIAGDSQGRVILIGSWFRGCSGGYGCNDQGERMSGYLRSYAP